LINSNSYFLIIIQSRYCILLKTGSISLKKKSTAMCFHHKQNAHDTFQLE
jgi:hypothetical protein